MCGLVGVTGIIYTIVCDMHLPVRLNMDWSLRNIYLIRMCVCTYVSICVCPCVCHVFHVYLNVSVRSLDTTSDHQCTDTHRNIVTKRPDRFRVLNN